MLYAFILMNMHLLLQPFDDCCYILLNFLHIS